MVKKRLKKKQRKMDSIDNLTFFHKCTKKTYTWNDLIDLSNSNFDCLVDKNNNCTFLVDERYKGTKNDPQVCT
jgi:hypothetical protein